MFFNRKKISFDEDDLNSIIQACINKNEQAERVLIKQHLGFAKSVCLRYASSKEDMEEIMNDGFLKVFANLTNYIHSQSFKGWMRRIMINTAIDYYRKNHKHELHEDIYEMEIEDFHESIISKISSDEIMGLIQKLPPSYRMVFTLFVIDGYSHKEIAEMLGTQEGTSKSNLRDARRKLQQLIKQNYPHLYLAYGVNSNKVHEN